MPKPLDLPDDDRPRRDSQGEPPLSRAVYIVLGILLGWLGVHNFYAGYAGKGTTQLVTSIFLLPIVVVLMRTPSDVLSMLATIAFLVTLLLLPLSILRDVVIVKKDSRGRWMQ